MPPLNYICNECAFSEELTPGLIKKRCKCRICQRVRICSQAQRINIDVAPSRNPPNTERHWHCPNCDAEIDHLNINRTVDEIGCFDLNDENEDFTDYDYDCTGDTYYHCPECGDEVDRDETLETAHTDEAEGGDK